MMGENGGSHSHPLFFRPLVIIFGAALFLIFYTQSDLLLIKDPFPIGNGGFARLGRIISKVQYTGEEFLVETSGCKLMALDPFDSQVSKYLKDGSAQKCKSALVTLRDHAHLKMEDIPSMKATKKWKWEGAKCCYRKISRVNQSSEKYDEDADYKVEISKNCLPIHPSTGVNISDAEHLKVECINNLDIKVVDDFFPIVLPPQKVVPEKTKFWESKKSQMPPSVIVLGVDSISRLHMIRSLPMTKALLDAKGFMEMRGYTKVGDNTFPNIMAAFAGLRESDWTNGCFPTRKTKLDNCPFLWKNFSEINYVTAHVEDAPGIAIFNYGKTGFVQQPADYYPRPLFVAENQHHKRSRWGGASDCLAGGLTPTRVLMRYIRSLIDQTTGVAPLFLLSWLTSVAHDDFNGLKHYDRDFHSMIDHVLARVGDDAVILFISDHGYRFGDFRETFMGYYEESLPFFFIRLPPKMKGMYPQWQEALKDNKRRLTSPHDLHSALVDILQLAQNNSGVDPPSPALISPSLFEIGPENRTCESSYIPQKYCLCGVSPQIFKDSELATDLGKFTLSDLNAQLDAANMSDLCEVLTYSKFIYGREVGSGETWNGFGKLEPYQDFLLAFEASPWEARFEARVRLTSSGRKEVLGTVSRINAYAGKSDCVSHYLMKNYCTCKSLWKKEKKKQADAAAKKKRKKHRG